MKRAEDQRKRDIEEYICKKKKKKKNEELLEVARRFGYSMGIHVVGGSFMLLSKHQTATRR